MRSVWTDAELTDAHKVVAYAEADCGEGRKARREAMTNDIV